MTKRPQISIIVPVYNAKQYLNRCIDSILEQTFTEFELLLINDGSTDGSEAICNEYATIDKRIRVYHKSNGGVSSARNLGIINANGKWIAFIDSDDWIDSKYFTNLISYTNADIIVNNFNCNEKWCDPQEKTHINIKENPEKLNFILSKIQFMVPWCKIFRLDIIKSNGLYFDESLYLGEDTLFVTEYLVYSEDIQLLPDKLYNYSRRENSLSRKYKDYDSYIYGMEQFCRVISMLEEEKKWNGTFIKLERFSKYMNLCLLYIKNSKSIIKSDYLNNLFNNKYVKEVIYDKKYLQKGKRRILFDFLVSYRLYLIIDWYLRLKEGELY